MLRPNVVAISSYGEFPNMNLVSVRSAAIAAALFLVVGAFASPQTKHTAKPAPVKKVVTMKMTATKCPVCHMPLSMKKTKANPIAVRLKKGGHVMYCCKNCKMPKSVIVTAPAKVVKKAPAVKAPAKTTKNVKH
jgi:hypothetical protein